MIDEELLSKWDCMQDLPISEEQLGAYMEGGLSSGENFELGNLIASSDGLTDLASSVQDDLNSNLLTNSDVTVLDGIVDWTSVELPEIASDDSSVETLYSDHSLALSDDDALSSNTMGDDFWGNDSDSFDNDSLSLDTEDYNLF